MAQTHRNSIPIHHPKALLSRRKEEKCWGERGFSSSSVEIRWREAPWQRVQLGDVAGSGGSVAGVAEWGPLAAQQGVDNSERQATSIPMLADGAAPLL